MSNDGRYERDTKHYSVGGDVSGIPPLREYCIPVEAIKDGRKILNIVGKGTRCLWTDKVHITTDKSVEEIAKELGIPEGSIYILQNRRR